MAWSRLLTFNPAIFVLKNKVHCPHFRKLRPGSQIALFHNSICLKNKEAVASETKDDSNFSADLNSETSENLSSLKLKILHAGLNYVSEHGWTKESISLGAQSLDLSPASHSLIQDGGADLVHYFNFLCNENLNTYLKEKSAEDVKKKFNTQNYLEEALENRLRMVVPFVSRWPEAMALMVSPTQLPADLENLRNLVDIIYSHSTSNPLNGIWYTKRISLAITYKLSELSLVQDKSVEFSDTFEFVRRRVETVMNTDNFIKEIALTSQQLPHYGVGALITVRNILGMNRLFK